MDVQGCPAAVQRPPLESHQLQAGPYTGAKLMTHHARDWVSFRAWYAAGAQTMLEKCNWTLLTFADELGFLDGSAGKESTCNVGDLGSILGWEDLLEKGKATHSSILAWRIPRTVLSTGGKESDRTEQLSLSL